MKKVFCDNCKKELPKHFIGEVYGFDFCGKITCEEKLTKIFEKEQKKYQL